MSLKKLSLTYIDEFGETCQADFNNHEYHSLMELLFDKYLQDWGDCKGRAWCGTCTCDGPAASRFTGRLGANSTSPCAFCVTRPERVPEFPMLADFKLSSEELQVHACTLVV